MSLKEQINNDLKAALLGGDRFKGEVLRGLKSVILDEEVKQNKRDTGLEDEVIEQLIAREIKKRGDSATQYEAAGRPELSETERREAAVITEPDRHNVAGRSPKHFFGFVANSFNFMRDFIDCDN